MCINPNPIHMRSIDSRKLKWSVQVNVLLYKRKQNITSLSLLVGTTVALSYELGYPESEYSRGIQLPDQI